MIFTILLLKKCIILFDKVCDNFGYSVLQLEIHIAAAMDKCNKDWDKVYCSLG